MPGLVRLPLAAPIEVHPVYGSAVLSRKTAAQRFALVVLSWKGQATLGSFGFAPLAAAP